MTSKTVYMKSIDAKGRTTYTEHRVWDMDTFIASMRKGAIKADGLAQSVTEVEYRANTSKKRAARKL